MRAASSTSDAATAAISEFRKSSPCDASAPTSRPRCSPRRGAQRRRHPAAPRRCHRVPCATRPRPHLRQPRFPVRSRQGRDDARPRAMPPPGGAIILTWAARDRRRCATSTEEQWSQLAGAVSEQAAIVAPRRGPASRGDESRGPRIETRDAPFRSPGTASSNGSICAGRRSWMTSNAPSRRASSMSGAAAFRAQLRPRAPAHRRKRAETASHC